MNVVCGGKDFKRAADQFRKTAQSFNDWESSARLALAEANHQIEFTIFVAFRASSRRKVRQHVVVAAPDDCEALKNDVVHTSTGNGEAVDLYFEVRGKQDHMLVRNIKLMEVDEWLPNETGHGLNIVYDRANDSIRRGAALQFFSCKGSAQIAERPSLNGEGCVAINRPTVSFNEETKGVIEGRSKVMDGVAEDHGRDSWYCVGKPERSDIADIVFGDELFNVVPLPPSKHPFKIIYVVVCSGNL